MLLNMAPDDKKRRGRANAFQARDIGVHTLPKHLSINITAMLTLGNTHVVLCGSHKFHYMCSNISIFTANTIKAKAANMTVVLTRFIGGGCGNVYLAEV